MCCRRKDCLRQLLIVLCERNELEQLVRFSYVDLEHDVVNILETRARSVDLTKHNYYDLLYAFHVYRGNFRKGLWFISVLCIYKLPRKACKSVVLQRAASCMNMG